MKSVQMLVVFLGLLMLAKPVVSQDKDLKKHPGYIDFEDIEIPDNSGEVTDINLGPALMEIFKSTKDEGGKGLEDLLSIRVKSFEIDSSAAEKVRAVMEEIKKKIDHEKWEQLVQVKKRDEFTNVSIKYNGEAKNMIGLLVMTMKPGDEVTFVNIVGKIDINQLSNFGVDFDEAALDSLKKTMEKK